MRTSEPNDRIPHCCRESLARVVAKILTIGVLVPAAEVVHAQAYPNKPIRIVTGEAAGGADFAARLITPGASNSLGQQVVVDNRASATIAAQTVAQAAPDGYTLLFYGSAVWLGPLMQNAPYNPLVDFAPVTLATSSPNILVVHPSLPVKSVKELIALAKTRPGELNYSAASIGSSNHLAAELFKAMAGINIVRISYRGSGPAINALLSGEVQLTFATAGSMAPHVKSGRLKALAVTSAQPSALIPRLPTVAASGLPGYESVSPYGLFAPAKTPTPVIDRLNQEIVRTLNKPEIKERLFNAGIEIVGSSPEGFAASIAAEMSRMGKVIKDAGIRVD